MKSNQTFQRVLSLALALTALPGCGDNKGSDDAYQSGSNLCSEAFISDTNSLGSLKMESTDPSSADTAESAINRYEGRWRDVNCKAQNRKTWQDEMVSANNIVSTARRSIGDFRSQANQVAQARREACPPAFISDTNALSKVQVTSADPSSADRADQIVNDYEKKYKGLKCKASVNGADQWVTADSIIAGAREAIADFRTKIAKPSDIDTMVKPVPNPANPPVGTIPSDQSPAKPADLNAIDMTAPVAQGVTFEVQNADRLNSLAIAGASYVIQKGVATQTSQLTNRADNLCYVERVSGAAALTAGEKVVFAAATISDRGSKLMLISKKIEMGCLRLSGNGQWSAQELQTVFGDLAKVVPAKK